MIGFFSAAFAAKVAAALGGSAVVATLALSTATPPLASPPADADAVRTRDRTQIRLVEPDQQREQVRDRACEDAGCVPQRGRERDRAGTNGVAPDADAVQAQEQTRVREQAGRQEQAGKQEQTRDREQAGKQEQTQTRARTQVRDQQQEPTGELEQTREQHRAGPGPATAPSPVPSPAGAPGGRRGS